MIKQEKNLCRMDRVRSAGCTVDGMFLETMWMRLRRRKCGLGKLN